MYLKLTLSHQSRRTEYIICQKLKAKLSSNTDLYNELQDKINKLRQESVTVKQRYQIKSTYRNKHHHNHNSKPNQRTSTE